MNPSVPASADEHRGRTETTPSPTAGARALVALNAAGILAATAFAAIGAARPGYVDREAASSPPIEFWTASSAIRTWAITIPLLGTLVRHGRLSPELLAVAGLVQFGDSALGIRQRNPQMTLASALMGVVHLATARQLAHQ